MGWFDFLQRLIKTKRQPKPLVGLRGIDYLDAVCHNLIVEHKVPALAATVIQNGELVLQKGYGYANLDKQIPVDPKSTMFRTASISKCITGLAFGKMVDEGVLNWDDSFYTHVPYYPKKKHDFTLRQLASHTAGIRGYQGKEYALNKPYEIRESIEVFKNDALVFEPGNGYLYNSYDFVLLSLAMQEAVGIPFEAYVKEKVLMPLGMQHTHTPNEILTAHNCQVSNFYTRSASGFKNATEVNNFYKLAGGGYLSTSEDIAKLGLELLNQDLLRPETYQQLLTAQTIKGNSTYYGLGFQVSEDASGRRFIGHVGSSIGAYTNFFVYPTQRAVVSLLINCTDPKVQEVLDGALEVYLEDLPV